MQKARFCHFQCVSRLVATSLLAFFVLSSSLSIASEVPFDFWSLATGLSDFSTGENDNDLSTTVQNPFNATQTASLLVGTVVTDFNFDWLQTSGNFLIQTTHSLHDVPSLGAFTESGGTIAIHSTQDLLIDLAASFTYQNLGPDIGARMRVTLRDTTLSPPPCFMCYNDSQGPLYLDPPNGSMSTSFSTILPANHVIAFTYDFMLLAVNGGTSAISTGNGQLSFTLTTVPECTTITMLLPSALLIRRRR